MNRLPQLLLLAAMVGTLLVMAVAVVSAHEDFDENGKGNKFEYYCCRNGQDCNRVDEGDLAYLPDGSVKHLPSGKVFPKDTHKPSTNKHQYACIYKGDPRCLYLRYGY